MNGQSLIYRNIFFYRFVMNALYAGKYKDRFDVVIKHLEALSLKNATVLELCFGDTYIADWCMNAGYAWVGIDINENFVLQARKKGYDASFGDLESVKELPKASVCIMMGSLYHFHLNESMILEKMFMAADYVIISEPVSNLSSRKGLVGFLARRAADAGKGDEKFRYNAASFLKMVDTHMAALNFNIVSSQQMGKDMIVTLAKRNGN